MLLFKRGGRPLLFAGRCRQDDGMPIERWLVTLKGLLPIQSQRVLLNRPLSEVSPGSGRKVGIHRFRLIGTLPSWIGRYHQLDKSTGSGKHKRQSCVDAHCYFIHNISPNQLNRPPIPLQHPQPLIHLPTPPPILTILICLLITPSHPQPRQPRPVSHPRPQTRTKT